MKNYLNFELEIKNLENELEKLKDPYNQEGLSEVNTNKISNIQSEIDQKLAEIYSNLNPWQKTMVARHENRPKAKFFIENLFKDFIPLSGDRFFGEDKSVLTGFGTFDGNSLLINTSTEINRKNYTINYLKSNKNGWNIKQLINYQNYKRNSRHQNLSVQ